jgi:DNA uptake protein ComE-like DNA-binding protein
MRFCLLRPVKGTITLILGSALTLVAQEPTKPKGATAPTKVKPPVVEPRTKGKLKPVDINHATKEELSYMLNIDLGLAAKIVANRPYKTKADLVVKKVFTMDQYQQLRKQVAAK